MAIDPTLAATNPQAAYALASVPVTAPQQAQAQQPAFKGSAQPTADTVNFSSAAAYAQPQQEEKSGGLFTLKNLFLTTTAAVLGLAAFKTHGTISAFKGLETAIDGTAVKAAKEGGEKVAEGAAKKVSDTHEISWLGTFADHLKHPIKLVKSAFGEADEAAVKTATEEAKVKVIGSDAKGLLYQSTEEGNKDVFFRHNDRFIKLTAKSTEDAAAKASKDAAPAVAEAAAPAAEATTIKHTYKSKGEKVSVNYTPEQATATLNNLNHTYETLNPNSVKAKEIAKQIASLKKQLSATPKAA